MGIGLCFKPMASCATQNLSCRNDHGLTPNGALFIEAIVGIWLIPAPKQLFNCYRIFRDGFGEEMLRKEGKYYEKVTHFASKF
jgi:hypothetical protein